MPNVASVIKSAEEALDKGDYNFCLKIIDPLLLTFQAELVDSSSRLIDLVVQLCISRQVPHLRHEPLPSSRI